MTFTNGHILLPNPVVVTKDWLLEAFAGGQPEQLAIRNFIETTFSSDQNNGGLEIDARFFGVKESGSGNTGWDGK